MLFRKPPVPAAIRKLPQRPALAPALSTLGAQPPPPPRIRHKPAVLPLAEDTDKIQFTARRAFRDELQQTQDLLRHRVPNGDLAAAQAAISEAALDALIDAVKKERFARHGEARPTADKPWALYVSPTTGVAGTSKPVRSSSTTSTASSGRTFIPSKGSGSLPRPVTSMRRSSYMDEYGHAFMQGAGLISKRMSVAEPRSTRPGTSPQCRLFQDGRSKLPFRGIADWCQPPGATTRIAFGSTRSSRSSRPQLLPTSRNSSTVCIL